MGDQVKAIFKKIGKFLLKRLRRIITIILLPVIIFLVILSSAVYWLTIDDGTYKEDDWSSPGFVANVYSNGTTIEEDGNITNEMSVEELWNKMMKNKSRVDKYLKGPEELARLMKAEMVTKYPDTRENPDEEIDWEEVIKDPDKMQGVIKFKRVDTEGEEKTLTYVDYDTFYAWMEKYNTDGDESARKNILEHFTLEPTAGSNDTSGENTNVNYEWDGTDIVVPGISEKIVNATNQIGWPGGGFCQRWVRQVYEKAGLGSNRKLWLSDRSILW